MYTFIGYYHRKGKSSKTGNEYEFFQCSFVSPYPIGHSECDGSEALNINVSPETFYKADLAGNIGKECYLSFNRFGRLVEVKVK